MRVSTVLKRTRLQDFLLLFTLPNAATNPSHRPLHPPPLDLLIHPLLQPLPPPRTPLCAQSHDVKQLKRREGDATGLGEHVEFRGGSVSLGRGGEGEGEERGGEEKLGEGGVEERGEAKGSKSAQQR